MFDLREKLKKTRDNFVSPFKKVFQRRASLSEDERDDLEEMLLAADVGVAASEEIMDQLANAPADMDVRDFLRARATGSA